MSNRLLNKKALVTGAGQGIGKETDVRLMTLDVYNFMFFGRGLSGGIKYFNWTFFVLGLCPIIILKKKKQIKNVNKL